MKTNILRISIFTSIFFFACSLDYKATHPTASIQDSKNLLVGTWIWAPEYPVNADTLVEMGLKTGAYWSWEEYRPDGFFSYMQATANFLTLQEWDKVVADTGTWRFIPGTENLVERHRERCVGYNRWTPPNNRSWSIPCRIVYDTVQIRTLSDFWVRNHNQTSQRWTKLK